MTSSSKMDERIRGVYIRDAGKGRGPLESKETVKWRDQPTREAIDSSRSDLGISALDWKLQTGYSDFQV